MVLLGLDVWQSLAVVVAGNPFWALVGWLSISGPGSGTPSGVVTRAMFGVRGNRFFNVVLGWLVGVAYEAINLSIGALAGFALIARWGVGVGTPVKVLVSSLVGPVVGASLYVVLTARSRRALRAGGAGADAGAGVRGADAGRAAPVVTVMSVE